MLKTGQRQCEDMGGRLGRLLVVGAALWLGACGAEHDPVKRVMEFDPPAAGMGTQYRMVTSLQAGQEIERCQFFVAPPEGLSINRDEVRYTPGSHHVLLYLTSYDKIPTMDQRGKVHNTQGVIDCPSGAGADWNIRQVIAGAQSAEGGSMIAFPPDVAIKVPGNAVLLMNTHYLNASPSVLDVDARINLYTIPPSAVKQEGGMMFYYNPIISVPARSKGSARLRCELMQDITLVNMQSHMHRRGVGYQADHLDAGLRKLETLYTNKEWEQVPVLSFDNGNGKKLSKGTFLDYRCDYDNPEDRTVVQGQSTTDEMCMLIGSYYPRHDETGFCMESTFVGTGTNECFQAYSCGLLAATSGKFENLFGCITESCPSVAKELTQALRCTVQRGNGMCDSACKSPADPGCADCVQKACEPAVTACRATKCS